MCYSFISFFIPLLILCTSKCLILWSEFCRTTTMYYIALSWHVMVICLCRCMLKILLKYFYFWFLKYVFFSNTSPVAATVSTSLDFHLHNYCFSFIVCWFNICYWWLWIIKSLVTLKWHQRCFGMKMCGPSILLLQLFLWQLLMPLLLILIHINTCMYNAYVSVTHNLSRDAPTTVQSNMLLASLQLSAKTQMPSED